MTKRYFIFDDHPNIRRGIKAYLSENSDWQCAGEASTCDEAVALVDSLPADAAERAVYAAIVDASFKDKVVAAQSGSDAVNANGFAIIRYIKSRALPKSASNSSESASFRKRYGSSDSRSALTWLLSPRPMPSSASVNCPSNAAYLRFMRDEQNSVTAKLSAESRMRMYLMRSGAGGSAELGVL